MKMLIIMHSSNTVYGAAKSLQKLLKYCDWEFDIVYPKSYFHPKDSKEIKKFASEKCKKVYSLYLPFRSNVVYAKKRKLGIFIWDAFKMLFEWKDSFALKRIIKEGEYDFVFLNSMVLYPLISKKNKYIVYVREMFSGNKILKKKVLKKFKQANKLVFIDKNIVLPFVDKSLNYKVINNPFDMTEVNRREYNVEIKKYPQISPQKIIIAIIGLISPDKGIDFIIDSFNEINRKDCNLIIVGKGEKKYEDFCKEKAHKNPDIIFLNEVIDINSIYCISDYIIRGDFVFATGRTVYEGLFSGCSIILQKRQEDINEMFEYDKYKSKIFFYNIRDKESLIGVINSLKKTKKIGGLAISNIDEYMLKINEYIQL